MLVSCRDLLYEMGLGQTEYALQCVRGDVDWAGEGGPHHLVRSYPYQYLIFQTILLFAAVGRPKRAVIGCRLVDLTRLVRTRDPQAVVRHGIGLV
ncbi:unnamed protein product, partial [Musa textilis]